MSSCGTISPRLIDSKVGNDHRPLHSSSNTRSISLCNDSISRRRLPKGPASRLHGIRPLPRRQGMMSPLAIATPQLIRVSVLTPCGKHRLMKLPQRFGGFDGSLYLRGGSPAAADSAPHPFDDSAAVAPCRRERTD